MVKGYKTFITGIAVVILAVLGFLQESDFINTFFQDPLQVKLGTFVIGLLIIILRTATSTGIFQSKK